MRDNTWHQVFANWQPRSLRTTALTLFFAASLGGSTTGCEQGTLEPQGNFPELTAADEWEPPDPTASPANSPVARHGQLRVEGLDLVDAAGEPVQLRGVSTMWLNWDMRAYGVNKEGMAFMRDNWGVTLFRAAMGVEQDGGYLRDPWTMTRKVRVIVQNAIDLGVYVLIDWHDHAAHLHTEEAEAFFTEIAAEFGDYPNVLYETFNEPLHPDTVSWSEDIKPYHEQIIPIIREQDPDSVIVLGTPQWSQLVDEAAMDPVDAENIMYTLHFYSCSHLQWLRDKGDAALALNAPLFVTEWGATAADGGVMSKEVCDEEAMLWHDWMDANNISWAAWKLDSCTDASCFFNSSAPASGG